MIKGSNPLRVIYLFGELVKLDKTPAFQVGNTGSIPVLAFVLCGGSLVR